MKKKIMIGMMVGLVSTSIMACGGSGKSTETQKTTQAVETTQETVAETQDIVLVDSGYSVTTNSSGDKYLYYGAVVNNPNKDLAAQFPKITITAKAEDGSIIATHEQTLFFIAPDDTVSNGGLIDCKGVDPSSVEFSVSSDFVPGDSDDIIHSSNLVVGNTSEFTNEYGVSSYTGEVENISGADIDTVSLTVILKQDGNIIYGYNGYIDDVAAGSKKAFEISAYNVPEHTEYIITAQTW